MKVLEEKPWTLEVTCGECGSKLQVEKDDVRAVEYEVSDCDHTDYSAVCPVCKSPVDLPTKDIAVGVREEAVKRYRKSRKSRW